jgi:hypothetical protein
VYLRLWKGSTMLAADTVQVKTCGETPVVPFDTAAYQDTATVGSVSVMFIPRDSAVKYSLTDGSHSLSAAQYAMASPWQIDSVVVGEKVQALAVVRAKGTNMILYRIASIQ